MNKRRRRFVRKLERTLGWAGFVCSGLKANRSFVPKSPKTGAAYLLLSSN